MSRGRRVPRGLRIWLLLSPAVAVVVVLFLGGLGLGVVQSFGYLPLIGDSRWTLDAYAAIRHDPAVRASLVLTLRTAVLATAISATLGVAGALTVRATRRGQRLASLLFQYNLSVPHSVGALCMLLLLQQSGLVARLATSLGLIDGRQSFPVVVHDRFGWGIIAELVWKETPFIGVVVLAALSSGVQELEEAARTLGAGAWQRIRLVVLPLVTPGLAATSIIVFAFSFGSYEVPFLLGRPFPATLPVVSYQYYRDTDLNGRPQAMAISVVIALFVGILVIGYSAALDRLVRRTA
ncbi:MAG: ABC transporter permease subunit [Actinomycetota bacterium]|nr:ABC transporter permease subunit [Actinomycetota bacterium]